MTKFVIGRPLGAKEHLEIALEHICKALKLVVEADIPAPACVTQMLDELQERKVFPPDPGVNRRAI